MPAAIDIRGDIEIKEVPAQPVLLIREREPLERMSEVIPAAYADLESYLGELGIEPTGPPVTCARMRTTREWSPSRTASRSRRALPVEAGSWR